MKKDETLEDLRSKTTVYEHYVHSKNPVNNRMITVSAITLQDATVTSIGFAVCNTKRDQYIRKIGNAIAAGRALRNPYKTLETTDRKEIVEKLYGILGELETGNFGEFKFPEKKQRIA